MHVSEHVDVEALIFQVAKSTICLERRWKGGNGPEATDLVGFCNLLAVLPPTTKRVVFTSSAGVDRQEPFRLRF